jgi:hypothetical protein
MKSVITKNRQIFSIIILIIIAFCYQTSHADIAPIVSTGKDTYNYGETINVNFSNAPGNKSDWICIVPVGSPDTYGGDYKNMSKGLAQGSMIFDPPAPGKYEVRAYYNYSRKGYVVTARNSFLVKSSPDFEKRMELERKINPTNSLEANLLPGEGLIYIFRDPVVGDAVTDATNIDAEIIANGKVIVVMPNATYFPFSVTAGDVKFTTGRLTQRDILKGNIEESVWSVLVGEAMIKVKPGYVYYIKLKLRRMGGYGTFMDHIPHQEGANLIDSYKLTMLK